MNCGMSVVIYPRHEIDVEILHGRSTVDTNTDPTTLPYYVPLVNPQIFEASGSAFVGFNVSSITTIDLSVVRPD